MEKNVDVSNEACNVQVTDLDEEDIKTTKYVPETTDEVVPKKSEALNYAAALKDLKELTEYSREVESSPKIEAPKVEIPSSSSESHVQELKDTNQHFLNQKQRSIKTVLKRNKSCANDVKVKIYIKIFFFNECII